jgi:hypothetical protein
VLEKEEKRLFSCFSFFIKIMEKIFLFEEKKNVTSIMEPSLKEKKKRGKHTTAKLDFRHCTSVRSFIN